MRVKCKKSINNELYYEKIGFDLNKEYIVMGVVLFKDLNYFNYLIDHNGEPEWIPSLYIDITDNSLPQNWCMSVQNERKSGNIFSLIGFNELCNEEDFFDNLIEGEKNEMFIYFKRKIEIENEEKLKEELFGNV